MATRLKVVDSVTLLTHFAFGGRLERDIFKAVLTELRVPDMPYPLQRGERIEPRDLQVSALGGAVRSGSGVTAVALLKENPDWWSVQAFNAAYVADRLFEMFVRRSPLDGDLLSRLSPVRFWVVNRLMLGHDDCLNLHGPLVALMNQFAARIGWSDSGSRSARPLLDALDEMLSKLGSDIESDHDDGLKQTVVSLEALARESVQRREKLLARLVETETGAARSRASLYQSGALLNRMAEGRILPPPVNVFLRTTWRLVLREAVMTDGVDSDRWKRLAKATELLVWSTAGDIAARDQMRLYQVAEQLVDRLSEAMTPQLQADARPLLDQIQASLVAQVTNATLDCEPYERIELDARLDGLADHSAQAGELKGRWFDYQGQRVYPGLYLTDTDEWILLNEAGMKVETLRFAAFRAGIERGEAKALPMPPPFSEAVQELFASLSKVLAAQRTLRQRAQEKARREAEVIRTEREKAQAEADARSLADRALREREAAEALAAVEEEEARRIAESRIASERAQAEAREAVVSAVERMKLGAWVELIGDEPKRLKLAVRTASTRKVIFTDRLGLNRTEFTYDDLVAAILGGGATILNDGAEFDDALSRVVGRIRVGRT